MIELQKKSPRDWITKPLKRVCEISTGMTPSTSNDQYFANGTTLWVKPNDLNEFSPIKNTDQKLTPLGVSVSRKISGGSVLICGIGSIGKFGFSPREVTTNQQIHGISFFKHEIDERFGLYLCSSMSEVFQENSETVVVSILTKGKLERLKVSYPPLQKQQLISRYLDKKTEQIDSLIEKIQKKIELLKEQRTSLINQCVTKGLDPNVEMKDSGIEWIGEIPSNWILSKFGFVASLETGNTPSKSEEDLYFTEDQNGFLWVKPSDLDVGFQGVSDSEVKLTFEGKEQSRVIPKDSILVCCIGNTSGKYSIANCDLSTNQQINSITFKDQIFPRYGLYYMDVFGRDLLKWMNFVTLPIISKGDLSQQPVIVPPKSEQIEISEILDKIISEHKVVTELHLQKIQLLKEYRQSLISSVVTGKVRVTEDMV